MESLPYPASPARIQALAVVSPAGYWLRYPPRDSPIPPAMAAVVAQGQLTATPITNPFGLASAAGVAADILGRLAPSLHLGSLAAAQDFYGIAPGDRPFNRRRYHAASTVEQSSSVLASRSTRTGSPPNCSRWPNSPSNQSGCRCDCARPASHRRYRKQLQLPLRRHDNFRVSSLTSAIARSAQRLS